MIKTWELTYDELYFLGSELNAKYINYDYYKKISNIDNGTEVLFKEAKNSLSQKKYLSENFFGESQISEELKKAIKPVFFSGNFLNIIVSSKSNYLEFVVTCYCNEDGISFVKAEETCVKVSQGFVEDDFKKFFSDANDCSDDPDITSVQLEETQNVIILKKFKNLEEQMPEVYIYCQGYIYRVLPDKKEFVSLDEFYKMINELFKGW